MRSKVCIGIPCQNLVLSYVLAGKKLDIERKSRTFLGLRKEIEEFIQRHVMPFQNSSLMGPVTFLTRETFNKCKLSIIAQQSQFFMKTRNHSVAKVFN